MKLKSESLFTIADFVSSQNKIVKNTTKVTYSARSKENDSVNCRLLLFMSAISTAPKKQPDWARIVGFDCGGGPKWWCTRKFSLSMNAEACFHWRKFVIRCALVLVTKKPLKLCKKEVRTMFHGSSLVDNLWFQGSPKIHWVSVSRWSSTRILSGF